MSALAGRVVIVTRAEHQAVALEALLRAEGATAYRYPCLAIALPDEIGPLDDALRAVAAGGYDWLVLTSANTVDAVAQRLRALGLAPGALAGLRVAAVGPSTARAARDTLELRAETIPESFSADALTQAFPDIAGARILLPQSALADDEVARALGQRGAHVTTVIAYHPAMSRGGVDLPALLARGAVDAITLTSASTARNLVERLQSEGGDTSLLENVCLACIGPSTARAVEALGLRADVVASEHTLAGLIQALAAYFSQRADTMTTGAQKAMITSQRRTSQQPTSSQQAGFPAARPRRLRLSATLRQMLRETDLAPSDFIYPLFVRHGEDIQQPIASMSGQYQWSVDRLRDEIREIAALGIPAVVLFGIPASKDATGSENYDPNGIVPQAIRAIKDVAPEMVVISDMCFCEYTDHGHCGIINTPGASHYTGRLPEGYVLNDLTLDLLGRASVAHAEAGADVIAPSGMMDGMVGAIRAALDEQGYDHIAILSYAAKYASGFYGPFRDAAESPPAFGDRSQYQMDPGNRREALREVAMDVAEGADMLMVKPALPYLDVLSEVRQTFPLPVAAYQVSGEYAMLHAAAANGWLDLRRCAMESLTSIKRAGADMILTYFAKDAVRWLDGAE